MGNILHKLEAAEDDANLAHLRSEVARLQSLADRRGEIAVDRRREIERLRLTDAERAAIKNAIGWIESPSVESEAMPEDYLPITNTLRGLLTRQGTTGHQE